MAQTPTQIDHLHRCNGVPTWFDLHSRRVPPTKRRLYPVLVIPFAYLIGIISLKTTSSAIFSPQKHPDICAKILFSPHSSHTAGINQYLAIKSDKVSSRSFHHRDPAANHYVKT
ncbi:unnamed protein product [Hymenolepis diminuta]|uniref:Uncharacterized protein n=1 Tax=Hymenolepis diminuta TaxID=6216 RepID=A0A564YAF5_HYMDI|nr:unnamed protein product [Hymenolepis diminuta]